MVEDLNSIFGEYNKEGRVEIELYNLKFAIGVKDGKETFKFFLTYYIAGIAPLNLTEF